MARKGEVRCSAQLRCTLKLENAKAKRGAPMRRTACSLCTSQRPTLDEGRGAGERASKAFKRHFKHRNSSRPYPF